MKNAYNIALGDWFNSPVIERVGRYGAAVRIWVTDDVRVAGVQVLVLDAEGEIREKGDATQGRGLVGNRMQSELRRDG
jgi:hypothetical protein